MYECQTGETWFRCGFAKSGCVAAASALLLAAVGCTTTPGGFPLGVWITDESAIVFPDTDRPATDGMKSELGDTVQLRAAVKERVAFQVSLFADFGLVGHVSVAVADLQGDGASIPANNVEIFRELPVELEERPGWMLARSPRSRSRTKFYDPLQPMGRAEAGGMGVPARGNLTLWFDVYVPPGTPAGIYRSTLSLRSGAFRTQVPIQLAVEPFALPDRPDLTVLAGVDSRILLATHFGMDDAIDLPRRWVPESPNYDKARKLLDDTLNLLRRHRCQPYVTDLYPVVKADANNQPVVEWASYDRMLSSFIEGEGYAERVPAQRWPLPIDAAFPQPGRFKDTNAPAYRAFLKAYAAECVAHFEENGWDEIAFIALPPNADPQRGVDVYRRFSGLRDVFRDIANPLPPASIRDFGWDGAPAFPAPTETAIWAPSIRFSSASMVRSADSAGAEVWLRAAEPPFGGGLAIGGWPTDARVFPWIARRWGVDILWIPTVDDWPAALRKSKVADLPPDTQQWLIYPGPPFGENQPLPSLRLKRLRRGIQDVQYLDLLTRNNRRQLADLAASCLVRFAGLDACTNHLSDAVHFGWEKSPQAWAMARQLAAEHIVRAVGGTMPSAGGDLETQLDWARLMEDTQRLRILVEGIRVKGVTAGENGVAVQARCHLLFMNDTRSPISGILTAGGEIGDTAIVDVTALPGRRVGERLDVAFAEAAGPSNTGLRPVSFNFDLADGANINVTSRLAAVVPHFTASPPKIDGRLDDWPLGLGNVASDFRLISSAGGETVEPDAPTDDRPTEPTAAFVMADDKYLYIGIRADESDMGDIVVRNNNFVRYDGMLPVGEDLVEIVIDPSNLGTTGPGEIYHLLVKANGAIITERGVPADPPVGPHRTWQADATAAVKKQGDHWAAEIAVPLKAFGAGAKPAGVWAINFARFHPRTAEYSNWAGVKSQIYNPRSMGNLVWPGAVADADESAATN